MVIRLGKQQICTATLRLARDALSMVIQVTQATNEYANPPSRKGRGVNGHTTKASNKCVRPPSVFQRTWGSWSYDLGKQQMRTPPVRLSTAALSLVIRLSKQQMSSLTLPLARDSWSMVIQVRQATNEYAHPPSRKGRGVNGHTTRQATNVYDPYTSLKARVVNGHTTKTSNI